MQSKAFNQKIPPIVVSNFVPTKSKQPYFLVSCTSWVMGVAVGVRMWVIGKVGDEELVVVIDVGL